MTSVDLRANSADLWVAVGGPVSLVLTVTDGASAVDLSGSTVVASIVNAKTGATVTPTFTTAVSGAGSNVLTCSLTGANTTSIGEGGYTYAITVDGRPYLAGSLRVDPTTSPRASSSVTQSFTVTTGDGLSVAVSLVGGSAVDSVNGATGTVVLDADDIDDAATTNKFATAVQLAAVDGLATTYQPLDADLTAIAAANNGATLAATTASFTTADETKLDGIETGAEVNTVDSVNGATGAVVLDPDDLDDTSTAHKFASAAELSKLAGIEAGADVTDTANVTAAGALMDSEIDADLKTLSLPANTTISTFGASLVDDADAATARNTLGAAPIASPTFTGSVVIPAATGALQAAQVTAIDATTGRLAIGGIEMGDTGWRDISADLVNGWTGSLAVRRIGNVVWLRASLNSTSATNNTLITLPTGFRQQQQGGTSLHFLVSNNATAINVSGFGVISSSHRASNYWPNGSFTTGDAWPATLPGTAA